MSNEPTSGNDAEPSFKLRCEPVAASGEEDPVPEAVAPTLIRLPVIRGGTFPDGFPFNGSAATMIEFLEGPGARLP